MQVFTHERLPRRHGRLPDIFLDNVERLPWGMKAADVMIIVIVFSCFFLVVAHRHRFIIVRRICLLTGLIYLLRAVTIFATVLPVPDPEAEGCLPPLNSTNVQDISIRAFRFMLAGGLTLGTIRVFDVMIHHVTMY